MQENWANSAEAVIDVPARLSSARRASAPAVARDGVQHRATGSCIQRAQCGRRQHYGAGDEFCEQHMVLPPSL